MNEPKAKRFHRYWTQDEADFIRANIETLDSAQMAAHLGRPKGSVKSYIGKVLKLTRSDTAKVMCSKANSPSDRRVKWTAEEVQYLKDNIQTCSCGEIASYLGKSIRSVRTKANRGLGLKKTEESFRNVIKRLDTGRRFVKGGFPHNTVFGDEQKITIRHHKNGPSYKWIRLGFRKWIQYHFHVWQEANGPIPHDHLVIFKNNDHLDVRLDNLELVSRRGFARRHSGGINLSDNYVAYSLFPRDKERRSTLRNYPELIRLKRYQLTLNRLLANGKITRNTSGGPVAPDEGQDLSV